GERGDVRGPRAGTVAQLPGGGAELEHRQRGRGHRGAGEADAAGAGGDEGPGRGGGGAAGAGGGDAGGGRGAGGPAGQGGRDRRRLGAAQRRGRGGHGGRRQLHHPEVAQVGDEDVADGVHRHPGRVVEAGAEGLDGAAGQDLLDGVVAAVGHEEV